MTTKLGPCRPRRTPTLFALALIVGSLLSGCSTPVSSTGRPELPPGISANERNRIINAHREALRGMKAKKPADAEKYFRQAVAYYSEYGAAWNNLGVALMKQERFLEAAEAFERSAELSPNDPRPLYNGGLLYYRRAYPQEAMPYFEGALKRDPNYLNALRAAMQTEIRTRDYSPESLERIQRALLLETNERWRSFMELHRLRVEAELENRRPRETDID